METALSREERERWVRIARSKLDLGVKIASATAFGRAILRYETAVAALENRLKAADEQRLLLAKLASDTPQFDNPLTAWYAQSLRDAVLQDAGLIAAPNPPPNTAERSVALPPPEARR